MKYKVLSRLKRDGVVYNPCEEVEFEETEVKDLAENGVLEPVVEETPEEEETEETEETKEVNYNRYSKTELEELAEEKGIDTTGMRKTDIVEALEKA